MSLSQNELKLVSQNCSEKVNKAVERKQFFQTPFQHLVIDDFFPLEMAQTCIDNFPVTDTRSWDYANDEDIEVKYRTNWQSEFDIPDGIVDVVRVLNSSMFLKAMSKVCEISKIIPDPYYTGGGLNVTKPNGLLDVHVDGNYHDLTGLNRRLNAILYLNPNWKEGWGGEFGLYDEKGDKCLKKVAPLFNRLVIFDTHDKSFHGLPDPLNFPYGEERRSIILYYYTKEERDPDTNIVREPHSALWKKEIFLTNAEIKLERLFNDEKT